METVHQSAPKTQVAVIYNVAVDGVASLCREDRVGLREVLQYVGKHLLLRVILGRIVLVLLSLQCFRARYVTKGERKIVEVIGAEELSEA